uniref:Uncharacterized protein n=1 Tax=Arundo donax TaxID=35708 RepID=A0A0A8XXD0_ARUDO
METGNDFKFPIKPSADIHQPCTLDNRCYNHAHEYAIDDVVGGAKSLEKSPSNVESNMSVAAASARYNAALQRSTIEPLPKKDMVDRTTVFQPQPCGGGSPNPSHYNDAKRAMMMTPVISIEGS